MIDEKSINIALIGTGHWGRHLVRNFYNLGVLKLICDKNETILDTLKHQYPEVDMCVALNEVLNRRDIHAVVIATPAETHFTLAKEALLSEKHVFVEKPLTLNESEAVELIQISRKKHRILMVGHLLQYHPCFVKLKNLAVSGDLGRINYIYSTRLNLGKIRREENILWSFAPHDISMILSLAQEEPNSLIATGANYLHSQIADVTTTHIDFPSGLKAHIFVSWLHPFKEQKLVVVGDKKMAVFDDTRQWQDKLLIYPHQIRWQNNFPVPDKAEPDRVTIPEAEPLRLECEHFVECIQTGKEPITNGEEGLRVLMVLKASQQSMDQHSKPIYLSNQEMVLQGLKKTKSYFLHETALVDDHVEIGKETKIWHFSHIISGSKIGERCSIGQNVMIGPDVIIGNGCKIQNNVSIYKGVTLEDDVFCGPSMVFTNVVNPRAYIRRMDQALPTLVKKGATLGANCTVVCGTIIGSYAFVGAGSVVIRDVHDHALMVGNPCRQIGWMCICGEKLDPEYTCLRCNRNFDSLRRLFRFD
ncbi:MAG: Gfo/Idh/MocA family oxidoreductase [Desulfobacterales bacterium]|nr:Gfo/Idh/MocA family oxidoreductase [Desulfobacterales bacterium]